MLTKPHNVLKLRLGKWERRLMEEVVERRDGGGGGGDFFYAAQETEPKLSSRPLKVALTQASVFFDECTSLPN